MEDDIPKYFTDVSIQLFDCLSQICPEETRQRRSDLWIFSEALRSVTNKFSSKCSIFLFGSQAEGSTTPGLKSDTDVTFVYNQFIVAKKAPKWDHQYIHCYFLTRGSPPGYVQVQCSERDLSFIMSMASTEGDLPLISYWQVQQMAFSKKGNIEFVHELEVLLHLHGTIVDMSFALQMKFRDIELPQCLSRQRMNPKLLQVLKSPEALDDCVNIEHIGLPLSFEWRLCFYATERRLVATFNSVQMQCYILLKMLVKYLVQPYIGNILSSYHVKIHMFDMIESTEETLWKPQNLLLCMEMCLKKLRICVVDGVLPDYFIPENNLFQDSVCGHVRFRLIVLLNQLLAEKGRFLLRIECDQIGDILARKSSGEGIIGNDFVLNTFSFELTVIRGCINLIQTFLKQSSNDNLFKLLKLLQLDYDHGSEGVKQAVSILIGEVLARLGTGQYMAPWLSKHGPESSNNVVHGLLLIGAQSGNVASSLKLAAYMYKQTCKKTITAVQILQLIRAKLNMVFSTASVHRHAITWKTAELLSGDISVKDILSHFIAHSVVYVEGDIKYTPAALVLEMHRSVVQGGIGHEIWYDWAVVDSKVYVLFLLYQCCSKLRMDEHRLQALLDLLRTIDQDINLLHRDTAFNLVAYCLSQEGITLGSYRCLRHSLLLNGNSSRAASRGHNAAIWQLAFLYNWGKKTQKMKEQNYLKL